MTHMIDRFLVAHGVDEIDLKSARHRTWLYTGILTEAVLAVVFTALAVTAWT